MQGEWGMGMGMEIGIGMGRGSGEARAREREIEHKERQAGQGQIKIIMYVCMYVCGPFIRHQINSNFIFCFLSVQSRQSSRV